MSPSPIRRLGSLATLLSLSLLATQARAANYTWAAVGSGNWNAAGNWTGGIPASAATTGLIFNNIAGGYTATNDIATNPFVLNAMTFNNSAGANLVTIAGANPLNFQGTATVTLGAGDATVSSPVQLGSAGTPINLTVSSAGGNLTLTGAVTDLSGALPVSTGSSVTKTGVGTLTLAGTNGVTNSSIGQLSVQGGAVNVTGGTLGIYVPFLSPTALQLGAASGQTASFTASGGATINAAENIFAGDVAGSTGTLTITGAGTTLNNQSTNSGVGNTSNRLVAGQLGTGFINVLNGGVVNVSLVYAGRGAGSTGTIVVDGPGSAVNCNANPNGLNVAQLSFGQGANSTATVIISNGGSMSETRSSGSEGNFFMASAAGATATLTLNGFNSTLNISGQAQIGGSGGTAGGTGTITANLGSVVNLTGPLLLYNNATVNVNTGTFNIGGLDDAIAASTGNVVTLGSPASTLTINGKPGTGTSLGQDFYTGTISGSGNVTVTGNTIQGFFGSSSYTGTTNINGGKLSFGALSNLGTGNITFNGGTLQWANNGSLNTSDITAGRSVAIFNGGATFDTNFNTITLANAIGTGAAFSAGGVTITGGGVMTFGGANTYFGPTVIQNGVLVITADNNLGSATDATFNNAPNTVSATPSGTLVVGGNTAVSTFRMFNMNGGGIQVAPASGTQSLTFIGSLVQGATLDATPGGLFATGSGTNPAGNAVSGAGFNNVTLTASAKLTSTSVNDQFFNFTAKGSLTLADPGSLAPRTFRNFDNQANGDGTFGTATGTTNIPNGGLVIAGNATRGSQVNVTNFQTEGVLFMAQGGPADFSAPSLLKNVGNTPMVFGAGSRTFINTQNAATFGGPAFVDLNGQNAIVTGGLFVNNGNVFDSSAGATATIIADYGALVKGSGFFANSVITKNGGKFQVGNSPGRGFAGSLVFGPGGTQNYGFQINDAGPSTTFPSAPGVAGPIPNANNLVSGWSLIVTQKRTVPVPTTGNFTFTATPASKLNIALETLLANSATPGYGVSGNDTDGPMTDFDPSKSYTWTLVQMDPAGLYTGPTDSATLTASTSLDLSLFANKDASNNPIQASAFSVQWNASSDQLNLVYGTAVPEPGSMALLGAAGAGIGWVIRRRKAAKK